jgi:Cell wall-active antibiotics response 4TMS YvqF
MSDANSPASRLALRDCRESAIQHISDRFVADVLSIEEFEESLSRVHAATTVAGVEALVAALAPLPAGATSTALAPLPLDPALTVSTKRIRSILGNVEKRGAWAVPAHLQISATIGNVELDFREARFTARVTELDARVVLGNLTIIVPPQLVVDCEGSSVLGNIESRGTGAVSDPERPSLRIRGVAVLGNIEVHTRLPGESERDDHRRRKRERLARSEAELERPASLGPIRRE